MIQLLSMFLAQAGAASAKPAGSAAPAGGGADPKIDPLTQPVPDSPNFWMPTNSSNFAEDTDFLFDAMMWGSAIVTAAVVFAMAHFIMKYRATDRSLNEQPTSKVEHSNVLEITWSVAPLFIIIALFVGGFQGFVNLRTPPKDAYEIHVTAKKWAWVFSYPEVGYNTNILHVPKDRPVRLIIQSQDVLHSVYIPAFRVKQDAVPGRYTDLWFEAKESGQFPLFCAEYCGTDHSRMLSTVKVHDAAGFEKFLKDAKDEQLKRAAKEPVKYGEEKYSEAGCKTCHSLDGKPGTGPSFKGLYGKTESLTDGSSVKVDENYLKQSIEDPASQIVTGYAPQMPSYKGQFEDVELTAIIEFIKAQK